MLITLKHVITQLSSSTFAVWGITAGLLFFSFFATRKLRLMPNAFQTIIEGIVETMYSAVREVMPQHVNLVFPFIATLWIFIFLSNMLGIIPGLHSPTSDLSVTSGLAILVFLSTHWFGIKAEGFKNYFRHYITPNIFILPFHIMGEITRIIALAIRLFGNMMSLELTVAILLLIAALLVPVPILMLHIVEACLQTYIFGMLALIYIAGGIQSQEMRKAKAAKQ